jgi:hypothetical protein
MKSREFIAIPSMQILPFLFAFEGHSLVIVDVSERRKPFIIIAHNVWLRFK